MGYETGDDGPTGDWPDVGEFIEIPATRTFGCVVVIEPSTTRPGAMDILLQEDPDQPGEQMRIYRLKPGEFTIDA